jgi:hypothetical protein
MNNFNLKSILLGIGMGIIITSSVSIIYLAGRDPMKELSKQEVEKLAEKYGLTINSQTINDGTLQEDGSNVIFKTKQGDTVTDTAGNNTK